jgi:hypothetical protein
VSPPLAGGRGLPAAGTTACLPGAFLDPAVVELSAEQDLRAGFRSRLLARWLAADLLLIAGQAPGRPPALEAGFSSPLFLAGPVRCTGLLREAANPLGFSPGSGVFREPTGLRLDVSPDGPAEHGLRLAPVPGRLALFAWESREPAPRMGGALALEPGDGARLEGFFLVSRPPESEEPEEWFPSRRGYPGGGLLHLGGSIGCAGRRADLSACFLLSAGERVASGGLLRLDLVLRRGPLSLELLGGACTREYRRIDGGAEEGRLQAGARVALEGPGGVGFALGGGRTVEQAPRELLPERAIVVLPGEESLQAAARVRIGPRRLRLDLAGEGSWARRYRWEGGVEESKRLELRAGLQSGALKLWARGASTGRLAAGAELRDRRSARLALEYGLAAERHSLGLKAATPLRRGSAGRLYAEAAVRDLPAGGRALEHLEGRIGWEARDGKR